MSTDTGTGRSGDVLLEIRDLRIEGYSDEQWHQIIKGVDLTLHRGEVMGLIGESGAGKSTLGLAAMGYTQPGCRINGGTIMFDGMDLRAASESEKRRLWGTRIAYVAQSAAASFNPAHRLIDQTVEAANRMKLRADAESREDAVDLYRQLQLPDPETIGNRTPGTAFALVMGGIADSGPSAWRRQNRLNTSVPLVPPKPKLFFTATSIFMSRAELAQ